jgi:glutamate-1-semialdehyde 2,1-aminomutase
MILGHAHPEVTEAIIKAAEKGTSYGAPSPDEVELAELIVSRVPSCEMVRFVNSGTEATMSAIRLARAATGRDVIVKFSGGYHGHADSFLIQAGSGVATFGAPDSPGVTVGTARDTRSVEYNDVEAIKDLFEREGSQIAGLIVEGVPGNIGVVLHQPGFLAFLRNICTKYGALLIFDEVMSGFRVHTAGAQGLFDITPDLSTFGKVIGGGLPVGAYGGRRDLMEMIAPSGPVYQAGTLSGNPLAMAAGLCTLKLLDAMAYAKLEQTGAILENGLVGIANKLHIPVKVQRVGSMLTLFFTNSSVTNYPDAKACDHQKFAQFFRGMLSKGVHLPPSGYEAWFISTAHGTDEIALTLSAVELQLGSGQ